MNHTEINFRPVKTLTLYSCKKNAWLIFNALKQVTSKPTFKTLLEISSANISLVENSPIDNLFYIYPYVALFFNYEKVIHDFINEKNIDLSSELKINKILQFLSYCDGYPSWETMHHHLSNVERNLVTFSFVLNPTNNQLEVYTFFDNNSHPAHGKKLNFPDLVFPEYDSRNLWGRAVPFNNLYELITRLVCFIKPNLMNDTDVCMKYVQYIYKYFRDIEQIHTELNITELDLLQLIDFEILEEKKPPLAIDPEWIKARDEGIKQLYHEFLSDVKIDNSQN